jgi:hypothetical protein
MATTATSIPNPPVTYALLVIFTVDPGTHAHLHDLGLIRFRGHLPRGGYDVPHVQEVPWPASAPALH